MLMSSLQFLPADGIQRLDARAGQFPTVFLNRRIKRSLAIGIPAAQEDALVNG